MSGAGGAPGAHPRCAGGDPRPGAWRPHLPWRAEPGRAGGGRSGRRRREEGEGGGGGDEGGGGRQRSGRPGSAAPHGPPGHSSRTAPRPARRPRPRGEAGVSPRRVISSANCRPGEGQDGGGGRAPPPAGSWALPGVLSALPPGKPAPCWHRAAPARPCHTRAPTCAHTPQPPALTLVPAWRAAVGAQRGAPRPPQPAGQRDRNAGVGLKPAPATGFGAGAVPGWGLASPGRAREGTLGVGH